MIFPPLPDLPERSRPDDEEHVPERITREPSIGQFPNELGVPVSIPDLRIVTNTSAIALDTFFVHADGVHAQLRLTSRNPTNEALPQWPTFNVHPEVGLHRNQVLWRIGVELSDGRRAATPEHSENDFGCSVIGGGGVSLMAIHRVYLSLVPPAGLLHLHVDFGDGDVRSVSADCSALAEASLLPMAIWDDSR